MLSLAERKALFKEIGLGYNKATIKAFQMKYMLRKSDYDGIYGPNTENTLLTVVYTLRYTKNFQPEEFRCECGGKYCCGYPSFMKPHMLAHIQAIRDHYGKPMKVTSGLRCEYGNKKAGGVSGSGHLKGYATDFYMKGVTDSVPNRNKALAWIKKQPHHKFTYGAYMVDSDGCYRSARSMGEAMHTETKK